MQLILSFQGLVSVLNWQIRVIFGDRFKSFARRIENIGALILAFKVEGHRLLFFLCYILFILEHAFQLRKLSLSVNILALYVHIIHKKCIFMLIR